MITTITTTTKAVTVAEANNLAFIAILALIALLIHKEIFSGIEHPRARELSQSLNSVLVPLLIIFFTTVVYRVMEAL